MTDNRYHRTNRRKPLERMLFIFKMYCKAQVTETVWYYKRKRNPAMTQNRQPRNRPIEM